MGAELYNTLRDASHISKQVEYIKQGMRSISYYAQMFKA